MSVPPQHLDIACHPFLDNPMVAVAPASHPMVGHAPITLAQLGAQRILSRERGSGSRMAIERHFREHGVEFMPKMEIGSTEAIKQAVIAGLGVTLMPLHAILMDPMTGQLAMLEVETLPIPGAWFAVHPGNRRLSIVAQAFLHYLVTEGAELMQRFEQHATTALGLVAAPAGQLSGGSQ
jgi:DNA-binding transcriptional LysR family regulator